MDALRVENLRSLADTGFVDLKPITLLVGENNSGKSTFLRTFPLLRQSVASRTTGPILWYGEFVDFGSFQDALNRSAKEKQIAFHFRFRVRGARRRPLFSFRSAVRLRRYYTVLEDLVVTAMVRISEAPRRGATYTSECCLSFAGHSVELMLDSKGAIRRFLVNGSDLSEIGVASHNIQREGLVPHLAEDRAGRRELDSFSQALLQKIRKYVHQNTQDTTLLSLAWRLGIGSSDAMLRSMQAIAEPSSWARRVKTWTADSSEFQGVRDLVIGINTAALLSTCDDHISAFAESSYYVAPLRATAERYYRLQNLAVDEVDFQGKNLAMFLWNLSNLEQKRFSNWTQRYFGFATRSSKDGGHISLLLTEVGSDYGFNLADKGFGFSQILPVLTQLWALSHGRFRRHLMARRPEMARAITFSIEQPELHLHPRLQARLADAFVDALAAARGSEIEFRLVVETHSEAIVNRLGLRVAGGQIGPEDVNVVIFEKRGPDDSTSVRVGEYDQEGFLTNWPFGFFEPGED